MGMRKYSLLAVATALIALGAVVVACGEDDAATIPSGGDDDASTGDDDTSTADDDDTSTADDDDPPKPVTDGGTVDAAKDSGPPGSGKGFGVSCTFDGGAELPDGGNLGCDPGMVCHSFGDPGVGLRCTFLCTVPTQAVDCPAVDGGAPKCNNKGRCSVTGK